MKIAAAMPARTASPKARESKFESSPPAAGMAVGVGPAAVGVGCDAVGEAMGDATGDEAGEATGEPSPSTKKEKKPSAESPSIAERVCHWTLYWPGGRFGFSETVTWRRSGSKRSTAVSP